MEFIADGLLIATAMTAGLYCLVLSRRLRNLTESGDGIGAQIEALDRALDETRAALEETRQGVSDLRASAKAAVAQLARETARGEETAERIERSAAEAKSTMQRLYEAGDRIAAHENRAGDVSGSPAAEGEDMGGAGSGAETAVIEAHPIDGDSSGVLSGDDDATDSGHSSGGPKVALPEGDIINARGSRGEDPDAAGARSGAVLKAERVML